MSPSKGAARSLLPVWRVLRETYSYIWRERQSLFFMTVPLIVVLGILNGLVSLTTHYVVISDIPRTHSLIPAGSDYLLTMVYLPLWGLFSLAWCESYLDGSRKRSMEGFIEWIFRKRRESQLLVFTLFTLAAFASIGSFSLLYAPLMNLVGVNGINFGQSIAGWMLSTPMIIFLFYTNTSRTGDVIIWLPSVVFGNVKRAKTSRRKENKTHFSGFRKGTVWGNVRQVFYWCMDLLLQLSRESIFAFDAENKVNFPFSQKIRLYFVLGLSSAPAIIFAFLFLHFIWITFETAGLANSVTASLLFGLAIQACILVLFAIVVTAVTISFGYLFPEAAVDRNNDKLAPVS